MAVRLVYVFTSSHVVSSPKWPNLLKLARYLIIEIPEKLNKLEKHKEIRIMRTNLIQQADLSTHTLNELWQEIGKRLNIQFGKIQMAFHNGKPSAYANIDMKIKVEVEENNNN